MPKKPLTLICGHCGHKQKLAINWDYQRCCKCDYKLFDTRGKPF